MKAVFFFLLIASNVFAQSNYKSIDKSSKTVPDTLIEVTAIAHHLTKDLGSAKEKIRALYVWIAHNIKYDVDQLINEKMYPNQEAIIEDVLKERKGVCMHYANLFAVMSKAIGVKVYYITGYAKNPDGSVAANSHAWNAVKIDGNYYLLDLTWAAGYTEQLKYYHKFRDDYFLIPPNKFIRTHMPFDPIWQFLENPIDNNDFQRKYFSKVKKPGNFNFQDSIQVQEQLTARAQLQATNRRIINLGVGNDLVRDVVELNAYNIGVHYFNEAIEAYNTYIGHRNKRFRNPKVSDESIKALIENAETGMKNCQAQLQQLFKGEKELAHIGVTDAILNKLPTYLEDVAREKDYVRRYLKTWKPLRFFVIN